VFCGCHAAEIDVTEQLGTCDVHKDEFRPTHATSRAELNPGQFRCTVLGEVSCDRLDKKFAGVLVLEDGGEPRRRAM
jgi:hypothetical protein